MRILLVNAVTSRMSIENVYPPLGLGYIAAYLRQSRPGVTMRIVEGNVEDELDDFRPDLVGISSVSQNYGIAVQIARACKERRLPVIIGGTHISSLPESLAPEMDLAVIGEGEQTFAEVVDIMIRHGMDMEHLGGLPGLAYRDTAGRIILGPDRSLIDPLDRIPLPARDLLRIPMRGELYVFSSRGCPYKCTFCQSTRFFNRVRVFSADYVVRELDEIVRTYMPVSISFYDDLFVSSKKRLYEIVSLIEEKGLHRMTEFFVNVRANQADEETASLLKRMNVSLVSMGLESGSRRSLQYLKPKQSSVEQNTKAVEIFRNAGLRVNGTFIIGVPGETRQDILETYDYIRKSRLSYFATYVLVPLPNTPLWGVAKERGLVSENMAWEKLRMEVEPDFGGGRVLVSDLRREELYELYLKFRKLERTKRLITLLRNAFSRPLRVLPTLIKKIRLWWTNYRHPMGSHS